MLTLLMLVLIPYVGLLYRMRGGLDPVRGWPAGDVAARLLFAVPFGAILAVAADAANPMGTPWPTLWLPVALVASTYATQWLPVGRWHDMGRMGGSEAGDVLAMSLLVGLPRHAIILLPVVGEMALSGRPADGVTLACLGAFVAFGLLHGPAYWLGYRTGGINHPEIARGPEAGELYVGMVHQAAAVTAFLVLPEVLR
jgi:uncharacterized membrane protein YhaH (DUF805 family)